MYDTDNIGNYVYNDVKNELNSIIVLHLGLLLDSPCTESKIRLGGGGISRVCSLINTLFYTSSQEPLPHSINIKVVPD